MAGFVKLYLPVFLLGALFGKLIEVSGFSQSIVESVIRTVGAQRAMLSIVIVCALLTYGGVSLFVVVFAVYPFAAEMFRQGDIPKRLIPGTIALGAFSFTMDALPGSPQIQNIIPTTFFHTTTWAAPWLGTIGSALVLGMGLIYLESRRRSALAAHETYGVHCYGRPEVASASSPIPSFVALLPLIVVGAGNGCFTWLIPRFYGPTNETSLGGMTVPVVTQIEKVTAIWAVEGALLLGILTIVGFRFTAVARKFTAASKSAVDGALMASINTAAVYGFGAVIAALPGFVAIRNALKLIPNPLVNEAVTVTTLAGVTGSASGGLSIALGSMADQFIAAAQAAHIPPEVLHRVAAMASGGMDTLPHNGAVITLLAVTGLSHRESYRDILAVTCIKTVAVFLVIAVFSATRLV
jgi:H+/gluconate symporter-like permease